MRSLVFTYGLFTDTAFVASRAPSTVDLGCDRLDGYALASRFHFTIEQRADAHIEGVVWEVDADGLERFDSVEGYPHYYGRIEVTLASGRTAWVYEMRPGQPYGVSLSVKSAYRGYEQHGLSTTQLDDACEHAIATRAQERAEARAPERTEPSTAGRLRNPR